MVGWSFGANAAPAMEAMPLIRSAWSHATLYDIKPPFECWRGGNRRLSHRRARTSRPSSSQEKVTGAAHAADEDSIGVDMVLGLHGLDQRADVGRVGHGRADEAEG